MRSILSSRAHSSCLLLARIKHNAKAETEGASDEIVLTDFVTGLQFKAEHAPQTSDPLTQKELEGISDETAARLWLALEARLATGWVSAEEDSLSNQLKELIERRLVEAEKKHAASMKSNT